MSRFFCVSAYVCVDVCVCVCVWGSACLREMDRRVHASPLLARIVFFNATYGSGSPYFFGSHLHIDSDRSRHQITIVVDLT